MSRSLILGFLLTLSFVFSSACTSSSSNANVSAGQLALPDVTTIRQGGTLRIGPLDMISVDVFGVEELSGDYQVDYEGLIKLPLVGIMKAQGYTSLELSELLEEELGETYLQDPSVRVAILESVGRRVTVEGSVKKPGVYDIEGQLSLLQAVALGGGLSDDANPGRVIVFRTVEGERKAAGFNLTKIRQGADPDPAIYGNDIVVVDGSEARQTYGDFLRSVPLLALFVLY